MNDFTAAAELMKRGQPASNPFAAAAEAMKAKQAGSVGMALTYDTRDPDAAAKSLSVGKALGVNPLIVDAEPEAYDARLQMQNAAATLRNAPKTAAWLTDMGNGVLAKDDIDNLSWFEKAVRVPVEGIMAADQVGRDTQLGRGVETGITGAKQMGVAAATVPISGMSQTLIDRLDVYDRASKLDGGTDRLDIAEALGIDPMSAEASLAYDFVNGDAEKRQKHIDRTVSALASNKELMAALVDQVNVFSKEMEKTQGRTPNFSAIEDVATFGDWLAFNTGQAIPYLAAVFAAGAVAGPAGVATAGYGMGVGDIQAGLIEQGILDQGGVAIVGGVPYAALEFLGPAAAPFRGVKKEVLGAVAEGFFKRAGKEVPKNAIEEFINEAGQEIIKDYAVEAGGGEAVILNDETLLKWFDAGMAGMAGGTSVSIVSTAATVSLERQMEAARNSGGTSRRLEDIAAQAVASKLRERAPDKFQEALTAQGLDRQTVFVPADGLKELFQAKDMNLDDETLRAWGIEPLQFEEAASSGQDVAVSLSAFATHIAGTDNARWFSENATFDPGEMSLKAAKDFNAEVATVMEEAYQEAERSRLADEELRAADVQIYDQMFSQLRAAGRSPDVAQNEARVWASFWRTMGERYGEDPLTLARQMGVDIRGPQTADVQRRRDALDISLNTLRTGKALKPKGLSLAEFVKAKGGIQDQGGDVAAMEAPKGVIGETREEYLARRAQPSLGGVPSQGKGLTLDEMGRMAVEAGYFPDLLGEVNAGTNDVATDFAARLLAALGEDVADRKVYAEGDGPNAELQALSDALSERGLDPASMTNDEIAAALVPDTADAETIKTLKDAGLDVVKYKRDNEGRGRTDALQKIGEKVFFQSAPLKTDPRILYQPGKRGSIVFPLGGLNANIQNGKTVINLFESADLSTFLHETSHAFLEMFTALASTPEAPQQMQDDLATIRKWLGNDGGSYSVDQHEKFARGSEAYFMEGKAPSLELADAFARFKSWLTRIYKTVLGLNVNITPEIRDVMDRMLATDAEIEAARAEQNMGPLFAEAPPGMSKTDFGTYQRMGRRASEQAEQSLLDKTMAKVRREKETWFKDEKKAVRAEVQSEYDRRPEYRLIDMLANQTWIGSEQPVPDMQIDRGILVEQFGDGVIPELSRTKFGGKRAIYGPDGVSPEEAAEFFGFPSASDMIRTLQNTDKKARAVTLETDRRMTERHGDPLNDGSIEEEALAAIHNDQQAETAMAEARHMAKRLGRPVSNMATKIYRQRARLMVGRMSVRDATRPGTFLAAERKAARTAQDAFAKVARGTSPEASLATALQAKEQQILNGFIYNEAKKVAEEVQKGREKMRNYSKATVRAKLEGGYIEQIDAILDDYDFRVRGPGQIKRAESLQAFIDRMVADGREGELNIDARLLDEAHRKHYTKLSVDELHGLFDTIDNLDHVGRFKQKLIDRQRARDLRETVDMVVAQVETNLGKGKAGTKSKVASAFNLLWRTDTLLVKMDGGKEIGASYDEIKRDIDEATSVEQKMHVDLANNLDALFKQHYSNSDLAKMKKAHDITGSNGRAWSKMEILAVALNLGNEDNFARLTAKDANLKNRLTKEHIDALLATMTESDWRFVQGMWDMVNSYWSGLADVSKRRTGVAPKKVEAKMMVDAPAFVTGGYYPIKYDPELSAAAATDEASGWDKFTATGRGATAAIRNGMTKQRQKSGGGRTLRLDLSASFAHMRDTVRYIALSEAVDNAHKVINHPDVTNAFLNAGQQDAHTVLKLWLKDVASGPAPSPDQVNTAARIIKNNFTLSRLAFNFKTVALQLTGVGQSAATIGKMNMIRGYQEYLRNPRQTAAAVVGKSAFMAERKNTFQKDIYDFANDVEIASPIASRYKKTKNVIAKAGFSPIVMTQFWAVDMPTWLGAFRSGIDQYNGDEAKAINYADRMVARSQDSGLLPDRAAFERGTLSEGVRQADVVRLFTTLGGYMLTKMNRGYVTSMQTKMQWKDADSGAQKVAIAAHAATDLMLLYLTEAILVALVYSAMTDDEDDEDMKKLLMRETGSAMVGGVPFVRDAVSAFSGYGGGGVYGSVMEAPSNFFKQALQGENDRALRRSIAEIVGTVTGLPSTGPMRALEGAIDNDIPISEMIFGRNPLAK